MRVNIGQAEEEEPGPQLDDDDDHIHDEDEVVIRYEDEEVNLQDVPSHQDWILSYPEDLLPKFVHLVGSLHYAFLIVILCLKFSGFTKH